MKQIVKNFNNLIKKTIFKVQNKTNNKLQISNFNKYLITLISLLFFYLFYLSIPVLYDKIWLQHNIESRLLKEFKINFSTSSEISYRILPKPHFLVNDSKIFIQDSKKTNSIANIKNLKIFINQSNFFNKEKMIIKNLEIDNANFSLQRKDLKLLNDLSYKKFSSKKIKVKNSNIFFKDNSNETVVIIKIDNSILFFDKKELLNLVNLKAEVFNVPFTFKMKNQVNLSKDREINIKAQTLKLNILNKSSKEKNNSTLGNNTISFLNSKINTKYNTKKNLINFKSGNSRINKSKIEYNGNFSINPFDLKFNIDLVIIRYLKY